MDIVAKGLYGLLIFVEILLIVERSGRSDLSYYLAGLGVQMFVWLLLRSSFEMELLRENGWIIILAGGVLLWFAIPWLKREAVRGDGGSLTIVEEEM